MIKKEFIPINWSVLYVGLLNGWLDTKDVVSMVNSASDQIECDQEILVDLNVNEDDKEYVLGILKSNGDLSDEDALKQWQLASLLSIQESSIPLSKKLEEISVAWSRFDYPEEWKPFIYYMPNEQVSSEEEVYNLFIEYISERAAKS